MGRIAKPWFRKQNNQWYTSLGSVQTPLGVFGAENESAAWVAFHRLKTAPTDGPTPVTVGEVIDAYLEEVRGRIEVTTFRTYRSLVTPFRDRWASAPAADLTAKAVVDYSLHPVLKRTKKWSPSAQRHFLHIVTAAYRKAVRERRLSASPVEEVKVPDMPSRGADAVWTEEELNRLVAVVSPQFGTVLRFLWLTGCRPGEAAGITAADVKGDVVIIRRHKNSKRGKTRYLYLGDPEAKRIVADHVARHPTGTIFRNTHGRPWSRIAFLQQMYKNRDRVGLTGKTMYGLRHSYATTALVNGLPDAHVAALLGHSGTKMLFKHYSHLTEYSRVLVATASQVHRKRKDPGPEAGVRLPSGFVTMTPDLGPETKTPSTEAEGGEGVSG